ncbi:hypothetical protein C2G38_116905 [Gigaspora rosea]|uniref:Uncharacterized protein n=1 Tax=Gigaspora rosea TaxID=44941 RepID=A0A397UVT9_9GLOM|nr:hypothetical protein C2G38_116905 [Gigaspora rosea]
MVTLAESLKKRENQVAKSMDQRFELSRVTVTNALGCYIEEEDNITTKVASEYKHRMDEYAEERRNCLRKLRLGFEKYQLIISDLLEALDKNHSQSMRARRDFEKDIAHIQTIHQSEITRLHEEIEKTTSYFHKTMESAAKEFLQKPSITKQFKSLLKFQ